MADSDSDNSSSSSDAAGRFLPKSQKGWGGGELEMEHQLESFREKKSGAAAVDISQFQNTEVGKGYQAKHVVRQKQYVDPETADVQDMTTRYNDSSKEETKKITNKKRKEPSGTKPKKDTPKTRLKKYMGCTGMRNFRREIQDILSS